MLLPAFLFFVFATPQLMAALNDANAMKIPNRIPLIVLAAYFAMVPFTWAGIPMFLEHLTVGTVLFAIGFAMFAFGWMGGGDSKLLAATAFWFTWHDAFIYMIYTALFGGAITLFIMLGRKYIPVRVMTSQWAHTMFRDETKIPYGLALAAGAIMTLPQSQMFKAALGL
ncbi:MAG: prepilin peptidase [Litorimonas sp.]|jgi:prepilin peptidase CpaA